MYLFIINNNKINRCCSVILYACDNNYQLSFGLLLRSEMFVILCFPLC